MMITPYLLISALAISYAIYVEQKPENSRVKRIVGGDDAAIPPIDDPAVYIYKKDHDAHIIGRRESPDSYYAFRGIRYAEPPVGPLRFQRPRLLRPSGEIDATQSGLPCPQPDLSNNNKIIGSEDCLFLNIFTPKLYSGDESKLFPVIFWIHGGGFRHGSASQYGPRYLVKNDAIVVTIQYRLGSLGFLSSGNQELPGNVGLFDQALALSWVKDYILYFNGDPNRITPMGQGSGASNAIFMALSNETRANVRNVIAMSGTPVSSFSLDSNPVDTSKELAQRGGCPTDQTLQMVRCLQEIPVERIIQNDNSLEIARLANKGFASGLAGLLNAAPVVEGPNDARFLPSFMGEQPGSVLERGAFPKIPMLIGVTKDETYPAVHGGFKNEIRSALESSNKFWENLANGLIDDSPLLKHIKTDIISSIKKTNYLKVLQGKGTDIFKKITEATSDVLFNLPAFKTSELWSRKAPTFLYRFEHATKSTSKSHGHWFLQGLPLFGSTNSSKQLNECKDCVGHGDDLLYLFEPRDNNGNIPSNLILKNPQDIEVRNIFTGLIRDFIDIGKPVGETGQQWKEFNEKANNYLRISTKPTTSEDFRFCEMGLWAGLGARLQSATCSALGFLKPDTILSPELPGLGKGKDFGKGGLNALGLG